jgi:hypothetical protein
LVRSLADPLWFVVDKVALRRTSLPVLRFTFVSISPPMLQTHLRPHVALTRRTNGTSLGTCNQRSAISKTRGPWAEEYSDTVFVRCRFTDSSPSLLFVTDHQRQGNGVTLSAEMWRRRPVVTSQSQTICDKT